MTARENKSARDVIIEHVLAMQGNALYTAEEVADGFLAVLVGAGLDAHDWLQLIGVELGQVGWATDQQNRDTYFPWFIQNTRENPSESWDDKPEFVPVFRVAGSTEGANE